MSHLCHPYGVLISCTCSSNGQIFQCVPKMGSGQSKELDLPQKMTKWPQPIRQEQKHFNMETEMTEIILSATFLLVVIFSFIG